MCNRWKDYAATSLAIEFIDNICSRCKTELSDVCIKSADVINDNDLLFGMGHDESLWDFIIEREMKKYNG